MEDQTATQARPAPTTQLRDELVGPPRPSRRAVLALVAFGLLLTATLAIDGLTDVPPMPGVALVAAGMMLLLGVAELLDPAARRLVIGVRVGGSAMALLGFAVQLVG